MKAELKRLHSPDVYDLSSFVPVDAERFSVFVQAMIGPVGDDSSESFDIVVCSPASLAEDAESGPVLGLHRIVMARFDYDALAATIRKFCEQCEGTNWQEVAQKVARLGQWEFEDYRDCAGVAPWNWDDCKVDFEADGSLRDIYVLDTTLDNWQSVLGFLTAAPYSATLTTGGQPIPIPPDLRVLFVRSESPPPLLSFRIGRVGMGCNFFAEQEIEFDFSPEGLTERDIVGVLHFMCELGHLTDRIVVLTPENCQSRPIFRCDPARRLVEHVPA